MVIIVIWMIWYVHGARFLFYSGSWSMRLPILLALLGLFVHNAYLQCKNLQEFEYTIYFFQT